MKRMRDHVVLVMCLLGGWLLLVRPVDAAKQASIALATVPSGSSFVLTNSQGKRVAEGKTPFIGVLSPGPYRLVLTKDGHFGEQRTIRVEEGQQKIVRIELMKKSSTPSRTAPPVQRRPVVVRPPVRRVRVLPPRPVGKRESARNSPPARRVVNKNGTKNVPKAKKPAIPWIPLAAAGALAIAGGVFWGLSNGSFDASRDRTRFQVDAFREYQQARTHRSTATFLFAASGVGVALGVLFYFWKPSKKKKRSTLDDRTTIVGQTLQQGE